jgi:hypothetical protein
VQTADVRNGLQVQNAVEEMRVCQESWREQVEKQTAEESTGHNVRKRIRLVLERDGRISCMEVGGVGFISGRAAVATVCSVQLLCPCNTVRRHDLLEQ